MKKIFFLILLVFLLVSFVRAAQPEVVINEIGWMGTKESSADEWIELYNNTNKEVNLEDWKLVTEDGDVNIDLKGTIKPKSFFILERTDDKALPDIKADQTYHGGLNNGGEYLKLKKDKQVVHEINDKAGWRAGNSSKHKTMELGKEWHSSREEGGTPKAKNSKPKPKEEQMPVRPLTSSLSQGNSDFLFTLMVALGVSIFSAALIYFLKQEFEKEQ